MSYRIDPMQLPTQQPEPTKELDHGSCTPDSDTGSLKLRDILNPARSSQFDLDDECEVDYDEE
ncbi:hypothetical protein H310_12252 [Aphanomyces invadans]|uniref:Uncharacterized protein n=1 Tax=Aphanomyces invadans TaxID=157072 RepID=A0A024TIQ7_9STRA|nr:hypothetical protein H310_12252 [Aphanomyces invadans]ETV93908.1 hypothetical protein H310_12252 [Aphanomyces invadans]|eukprot:XP_008877468.1 hypothetical protein H310_12252 [Aphanomyces invadans]